MKRIIDIGCGPGIYVDALKNVGFDVVGIDTDAISPGLRLNILNDDDYKEIQNLGKFDICLCLEVAEHINPEYSKLFVHRLTTLAQTIIFSAAQPGQGGDGHINCRPPEEWEYFFSLNNFVLNVADTHDFIEFMKQGYHLGWLTNNVRIYQSYGLISYKRIIEEETEQAYRVADYLKTRYFYS